MLNRAAKHLSKANQLQSDADDVLREAIKFTRAGEVDDETDEAPGDPVEHARLMALHARLVDKARKHTAKARAILEQV